MDSELAELVQGLADSNEVCHAATVKAGKEIERRKELIVVAESPANNAVRDVASLRGCAKTVNTGETE